MNKQLFYFILGACLFHIQIVAQNQNHTNIKATYHQYFKYKTLDSIKVAKEFRQQYLDAISQKKLFELIISDKKSKYSETPIINNQQGNLIFKTSSSQGDIYKDLEKNIIFYEMNFPKSLFVKDTLSDLNWYLIPESDSIINGFPVNQATAKHNDSEVKAWFTNKIPIPDGPSEFYGLPGLIVELEILNKNGNEIKCINLESIEFLEKKNRVPLPNERKTYTMEEYKAIVDEFLEKEREFNSD